MLYGANETDQELKYLQLKARGLYPQALDYIADWTADIEDPELVVVNLFRIDELLRYPEQFKTGLAIYDRLEKTETVKNNPETLRRLLTFKQSLLLRMNKIPEASALKKRLNFMDFSILGPFASGTINEFETEYPVMELFETGGEINGKNYPVSWFPVYSDLEGAISLNGIFPEDDILNNLFYLHTKINIQNSGRYRFTLGKTGFCRMNIDDTEIFYNTERHDYSSGQYAIEADIPSGSHNVLIKLDSSRDGSIISCSMEFVAPGNVKKIEPVKTGGLGLLFQKDAQSEAQIFRIGYLIYKSGLNRNGTSDTLNICSTLTPQSPYYAAAQYYSALSLALYESRDEHLQKSIAATDGNTEALFSSVMINLNAGFPYKAWPLMEELKKVDSSKLFYATALTNFYETNNWRQEAEWTAKTFTNIGYPSLALYYSAVVNIQNNNMKAALDDLEKLYMLDPSNNNVFLKLLSALEYSDNPERSVSIINGMTTLRPNDINLLLTLSSYIEKFDHPQKAIPPLSAALKRSPNNNEALYRLAMIYHKTGKNDLASFYMNESIKKNPSNHALKQYLDFLHNRSNIFSGEMWDEDISVLEAKADKLKNQNAVYLLNEQIYHVNEDASYEKYVRCIIKIYDDIAINDFNLQYIVYEPGIDSIENIRCKVINGGEISAITERYTQQMSDPESRLYYNLEAVSIPVQNLRKGSILDFSYTLKNKGGTEYRNSFSETVYPGGTYPIVLYRTALSHPENKTIYLYTKNIDNSKIKKKRQGSRIFYNIEFNDLEPYKPEPAMPARSEILPAVYFSSYENWNAFASWYRSLLKDKIIMSDEMVKAFDSIISPNDSKPEKVRKIFNHITDSIRYVGFELGIGALQPRPSDQTYRTRMGDCKDIALVLAAFLRRAGIDASIALIKTRDKGTVNKNAPSTGEFNHAICYADANGGIFLDATLRRTSYLEIFSNERNVDALVIDEKSWRFVKTENPLYAPNIDNISTIIDIESNGDAVIKRALKKQGDMAISSRGSFDDLLKKEQSITEYWNKLFPGARVSKLTVDSSSRDKPVIYSYSVHVKNFAFKTDKELIFPVFLDDSQLYYSYTMNSSRKFPLSVTGEFQTISTLKINLPANYKPVNIPKNKVIKHHLFETSYIYSFKNSTISINSEFKLKTYNIPTENYAEFRAMARSVQEEESRKIILELVND